MKIAHGLAGILPAALAAATTLRTYNNLPLPIARHNVSIKPSAPSFTFDELFRLQKKFLDAFVYPANGAQAKQINSSLLAPNVQGRVDITRTFTGAELNTEYLFGLFANLASTPDAFTLLGVPISYEITHFAASQNIASASTRFIFKFPLLPNLTIPLQIDTWNAFDVNGQISQYDATFKWWTWTSDYLLTTAANAKNTTVPLIKQYARQKLAASICETAKTYCNSSHVRDARDLYKSEQECAKFLGEEVRFGEAYELGRNTLLCRMVHQNMVSYRPETHCPHIGPLGGGMCVDDHSYAQTVTENFFSNFPFAYGGLGGLSGGQGHATA